MTHHLHLHQRLPLEDSSLAPATFKAYTKQLQNFFTYASLDMTKFYAVPPSILDSMLAHFIQHSYDNEQPFTYASHALHAVIFFRQELKHSGLYRARACIRGWEKKKQVVSHPPLTWELAIVIAVTLSNSGYHAPAVGMLLAFDCYLRVGELTRLRRKDVVMPNDPRMGRAHSRMALRLRYTKTGQNQSVDIQRPEIARLVAAWVRHLPPTVGPSDRVFDFSPQWLGRLMRNACIQLGIGHIPYVPHSLRHGGATTDYLVKGSVEYVHHRGRWKSLESLRTYVQTAQALLTAQNVPSRLNDLGQLLAEHIVDVLRQCQRTVTEVVPRRRGHRVTFRL